MLSQHHINALLALNLENNLVIYLVIYKYMEGTSL
jgi:hypothetical protein